MNLFERLHMNYQLFAADTGADGGSGETDADQKDTGTEEKNGTGETETKPEDEKTFTQKDVNSIAAKEARKAQEKLFKEVGIEDFDNAKEGLQKFKEWQDSQKTEAEKQSEAVESLQGEKEALTNTVSQLEAQISAMNAGVDGESVEDVIALAERLVNDDTDIDAAIKQVIDKYPHFAGADKEEEKTAWPNISKKGDYKGKSGSDDPFAAIKDRYKKQT